MDIRKEIDILVFDLLWNSISNSVYVSADISVWNTIGGSVDDLVWNSVRDSVRDNAESEIKEYEYRKGNK
jgi:hypothetical protein